MVAQLTKIEVAEVSGPGDSLQPGSTVAHRYRIVRYCGDRGFGQVYEAEDSATDARVSLMRLHSEFSHPRVRDSFFETRATAAVEHPRILDLNDYGEDLDGRLFLTTPWIPETRALDEWLSSRGPLPWARIQEIIEQVAEALEAAHQKGVLHGGLDLSHILIDADEEIYVVDFGLAPALTMPGGRPVTNTGPLPGNPTYLAPEQLRGEANDARSDVYALGIIMWELIAGQPPFVGDPVTVANAQLEASLPELVRRDAPVEIEPLLFLALAKDKEERLASADEFAALLQAMPGSSHAPTIGHAPTQKLPRTPAAKPSPASAPPAPPAPKLSAVPSPPAARAPASPPPALPVAEPVTPEPSVSEPSTAEAPPAPPESDESGPRLAPAPVASRPLEAAAPSPVAEPAPPPKKRRLGKLELAILLFLGFDVLVVAAWLLFGRSTEEPEVASDDTSEQASSEAPQPSGDEPPSAAEPAEPAAESARPAKPAAAKTKPTMSVEEAVAAALPPEPESAGPVRPLEPGLTDKDFREAMVDSRDKILEACMDSRMRRTLKVQLKVAPEGKVSYARVMGGLSDTNLGRCVTKQAYGIDFPTTKTGGTHVYTLRLR